MSVFARKPIAELVPHEESPLALRRVLGAGDLVMLSIGAVIGAGIFGAIGASAVGQVAADGAVIRAAAGPAVILSFIVLAGACALVALCYSELAAMIPQAGSAYAYSYATLGEGVAWIVGWVLILEYAVGNVALAISWGGHFNALLGSNGILLPQYLTTGYRTVLLSSDPAIAGLVDSAPRLLGLPLLLNVPAFAIVMLLTVLVMRGARDVSRANAVLTVVKLLVLGLFVFSGMMSIDPANYSPFAPNGFTGIRQGAAMVFFAFIGFDAISTAAEETRNPQRNLPVGILGGLIVCALIYVAVAIVLTGLVPYATLAVADPLPRALEAGGLNGVAWLFAIGAVVSMSSVLLVFQYGQPRILFAMARDGLLPRWAARVDRQSQIPSTITLVIGVITAVAASVGDAVETYDLTNIGALLACAVVCVSVLVLRVKEPTRPRPFRVPLVWLVAPAGILACVSIMVGLPASAWQRFGWWLAAGGVVYAVYGYRHSSIRRPLPADGATAAGRWRVNIRELLIAVYCWRYRGIAAVVAFIAFSLITFTLSQVVGLDGVGAFVVRIARLDYVLPLIYAVMLAFGYADLRRTRQPRTLDLALFAVPFVAAANVYALLLWMSAGDQNISDLLRGGRSNTFGTQLLLTFAVVEYALLAVSFVAILVVAANRLTERFGWRSPRRFFRAGLRSEVTAWSGVVIVLVFAVWLWRSSSPSTQTGAVEAAARATFESSIALLPDDPALGFIEIRAGQLTGRDDRSGPRSAVAVPAFLVGKYEVTVAQYRLCVDQRGCTPHDSRAIVGPAASPVRYVSWIEAMDYCRWLDGRLRSNALPSELARLLASHPSGVVTLPSEEEWEYAAAGAAARSYPWGPSFVSLAANSGTLGRGTVTDVGLFPSGVTPEGVFDLSGNVAEWTKTGVATTDQQVRIVRGGSFYDGPTLLTTTNRMPADANVAYDYVGFRVAISSWRGVALPAAAK